MQGVVLIGGVARAFGLNMVLKLSTEVGAYAIVKSILTFAFNATASTHFGKKFELTINLFW